MPWGAIAKGALSLAAPLLGALGGKGKTKQVSTEKSSMEEFLSQLQTMFQSSQTSGQELPVETPEIAQARLSMLPLLGREFGRLDKPIFGQAERAGFVSNLNDLANSSMESLKASLARTGSLDSGRAAALAGGVEMGRSGQVSKFLQDLPFREQGERLNRFGSLFQLGTGLLGQAPVGRTFGSQSSGESTGTMEATGRQTGTKETTGTASGPGFGSTLGHLAGGMLMPFAADWLGGLFKKTPAAATSNVVPSRTFGGGFGINPFNPADPWRPR